jgi:hypothetical protein
MVASTRSPSLKASRLLTPWILGYSKLGTSVTRSPSCAMRMWISVSISKPSPHNIPSPLRDGGEVISRSSTGTYFRQNTLNP